LYAAVGAAGVGPGDEVIVSPYTMSASATAAVVYGGIPIFADIDPETFVLTPESIRAKLTPRTKAIVVVDLFGHPADIPAIMELARERNVVVIEDVAQAPGASRDGILAGTAAHMGVYSLNYHKTIHTGEGGMVVTGDARLAERLQLIRNHAEVVVKAKGVEDLVNMVGFNYRMTEIEAAIGFEQLRKLESLLSPRDQAAERLGKGLSGVDGLATPVVAPGVRHGYYQYAMRFDASRFGTSRKRFVEAVRAEGIPLAEGYVEPIYLQPMYQERIAFGRDGFPFNLTEASREVSYARGLCPVAERMHFHELVFANVCHAGMREADLDDVIAAIRKVKEYVHEL
jgi:dTDP-4-amino-4,6-dideoxygalactose transaminase